MKKYFLAIASFFIYSHISLGQVYPGQMDSTFVPVRSHHYDPELTFDFCVNEPAWSNQAGIHSAFGSTDRLYFRKEVPVNHDNDLSSSYSTTVWRGERANAQILVWSSEALEQVRVSTQDLRSAEGNIIPKDRITFELVRYVLSNYPYAEKKAICGESPYKSPTDMGVNMVGNCIVDDEAVKDASRNEIIRRYYKALCEQRKGNGGEESIYKLELLMKQAGTGVDNRPVAAAAMKRAEETGAPAAAIELPDGAIVTGKTSSLLGASSAMLLNALKKLANLDHDVKLISPTIIEPIQHLKVSHLGNHNPRLHTDEILIALCICAATDEKAELAMQQLEKLKCCEVHSSVILSGVDENVFQKLGVNLTCEPIYQTKKLFHG